jgi:adenylate cyclase
MTDSVPIPLLNPADELQRMSKLAGDLADKLRAQRDILVARGMQAPASAIDSLNALSTALNQLLNRLDGSDIELQQFRELAHTTEIINSRLDLDLVLNEVIDTVIQLTHAERGYIVLKDRDTGDLIFRVARDEYHHDLSENEFVVSRTIVDSVAEQGELVVTLNAVEDTRFENAESVANLQLRSILAVPLKRKGQVTGVLYADNRMKPNLFTEREQRLVNAFAHQAAVAIENARLFEEVRASLSEITAMRDFLSNMFDSIASGVITTDGQDQITTFNAAAARILGIAPEQAVSQSLWRVLPPLYEGFDKLVEEVREHNLKKTIEVDPVIEGRGQITLNLKLSPLKDARQVTQGVAIVADDLTELKQREAQLSVVRRYLPPELVANIKTIDELELGGVERDVSVLFCDVRGFTTFSEKLQPETLMEVINQYLTVSSDSIHTYEGIIDKFMGDAVVGLFNTQLNPHEDHAMRAIQAALLMVDKVTELHQSLPGDYRLFYGIGVHTGPAVLGNVGSPRRKEFTAIGNSLQFAKLLQENALGGEVLTSQETYDLVKDYVIAEALPPRKMKDHLDFTVMYRVTGLVG